MTKRTIQSSSIKEVAALAGVSIATVSRVVNGVANKASAETVERVRRAIATLDYRPTSAGRDLRQRTSRLVAVLAANLANPAMTAIAASAETALRENGLVMVLCDTHDQPDLQDEYIREMLAQQARAIVLLGAVDSPMLRRATPGPIPLIFVNRRDPTGAARPFIGIDNRRAGTDVARWALAHGLADAALVHAPTTSSATRERVQGIRAGFAAAGMPLPDRRVLSPRSPDHMHIGLVAGRELLERGDTPDLVICTGDLIAFGIARAWRDAGQGGATPRLIGFDDSPMNAWLAPGLSSVRIPYDAYGRAIVAALLDGEGPSEIVLEHRIIERSL